MVSEVPTGGPDPAEAALAQARANSEAARATGSSYGIALALTQAGHALLSLRQPDQALADFDEALRFIDLLRADGQHEQLRLLSIASLSLAPPDQQLGDLDTLEAWIRVGRAAALTSLGDHALASEAVTAARPWVRGWRRRQLRRALDIVADQLARASGSIDAGLQATTRAAQDSSLAPQQRHQAQYEHMHLLVEAGQNADAAREALQLLKECDDDPALSARVRQVLGAALAGLGQDEDATVSLRAAFAGFVDLGDQNAIVSAAPGLANRLGDSGDAAGAIEVIKEALSAARLLRSQGDDAIGVAVEVDLLSALATYFDEAGESIAAIDTFAKATSLAEDHGEHVRAADARHGEAIVRIRSGDTDDAIEALSLLEAARTSYIEADLGMRAAGCNHEAAALLARMGSHDAAASRYATALAEYQALDSFALGEAANDLADRDSLSVAISDCERNITLLQHLSSASGASDNASEVSAFAGGGHRMRFGAPRDS